MAISASTGLSRPSIFVGSSAEGLPIARILQVELDRACEVTLWSQGVFGLGEGTLEALVRAVGNYDFAILVLTPDDLIESRGQAQQTPRDNVLLELGLFLGALGRGRTFVIYNRRANLRLPSDLAGVTMATYEPHQTDNLHAALGAPCTLIENAIRRLGLRPERESVVTSPNTLRGISLTEAITSAGLIDIENRSDIERALPPIQFYHLAQSEIVISAISAARTLDQHVAKLRVLLDKGLRLRMLLLDPRSYSANELSAIENRNIPEEIRLFGLDVIVREKLHIHPGFSIRLLRERPHFTAVMIDGDLESRGSSPSDEHGQIRIQPATMAKTQHAGIVIQLKKTSATIPGPFDYFAEDLRNQWKTAADPMELFR